MIIRTQGASGEDVYLNTEHVGFIVIPTLLSPGDGMAQIFVPPTTVIKVSKESAQQVADALVAQG